MKVTLARGKPGEKEVEVGEMRVNDLYAVAVHLGAGEVGTDGQRVMETWHQAHELMDWIREEGAWALSVVMNIDAWVVWIEDNFPEECMFCAGVGEDGHEFECPKPDLEALVRYTNTKTQQSALSPRNDPELGMKV